MKASRLTLCGVLGLAMFLCSQSLRAQSQNNNSTTAAPADVSKKVEELQKELDALQAQIAELKKQQGPSQTAPAAPSSQQAPAATAAVAPTTEPSAGAPPAKTTLASLLGPLSVTGFVDGYYGYDFEHPHLNAPSILPGNPNTALAGFRAFDSPYSQFMLNNMELVLDKPPDANNSRLGYHASLWYGNATNVVDASDPVSPGFALYLKEAYGSYLAPLGKGLEIDFGKFVTQHGAEVIESKDNWNYSRSLLFTYAIPFYHYGLRTKYIFNDKYQLSAYLVNGWNNQVNNNTGLTFGVQFGWNPNKKFSLVQNYMIGPEETNNNSNFRQLWDTVATYSPTSKLSLMLNFDYGRGDRVIGLPNPVWWSGVASYLRYQFNDKYALTTRYEYYNDPFGFTTFVTQPPPFPGYGQHINEVTETFERKIHSNLITRLEYRRDMASRPTLYKGTTPVDYQDTLTAGLIFTFDLKELK
jgi:hypothetical protein